MAGIPVPFAARALLPSSSPPALVAAAYDTGASQLTLTFDQDVTYLDDPPGGSLIVRTAGFNVTAWELASNVGPVIVLDLTSAEGPSGDPGTGSWDGEPGVVENGAGEDWPAVDPFIVTVT